MNAYEPSKPRAAFGLAAVLMTSITIGAMVVLPAKLTSVGAGPHVLAAAKTINKARSTSPSIPRASTLSARLRGIEIRILAKE